MLKETFRLRSGRKRRKNTGLTSSDQPSSFNRQISSQASNVIFSKYQDRPSFKIGRLNLNFINRSGAPDHSRNNSFAPAVNSDQSYVGMADPLKSRIPADQCTFFSARDRL